MSPHHTNSSTLYNQYLSRASATAVAAAMMEEELEDASFQPNVRSTASAHYLQNMIHTPTLLELNLRLMDKRRQDREEQT